jgi:tetratricopeptide (TPR) repeat protein
VRIWLSTKFHELDLFDEAFVAVKKAIAIDPTNAAAWRGCGELLWFHLNKQEGEEEEKTDSTQADAEVAFKKAIELDPRDAWSYSALASILRCRGDIKGAEEQVRKALELDEN